MPALIWIGIIFWLSSLHQLPAFQIPMADKIAHFCFYVVLCAFTYRGFFLQERFPRLRQFAASGAMVFTLLYGITDEVHQLSVWGRTSDILDLAVDALGGLAFIVLLHIVQRYRAKPAPVAGSQATV